MKQKTIWMSLLLATVLLVSVGCEGANGTTQGTPPAPDTAAPTVTTAPGSADPTSSPTVVPVNTAPDFTVYDEQGNPYKLSDFFGTPIVLNFWASWCPPCKAEMPEFDEKALELEGKVQFMMVNVTYGDVFQDAVDYVKQQGYQFPVFYDLTGEAAYTYMVEGIPVTYFINAEGRLVTYRVGMLEAEELESYISLIYGG